MYLKKNLPYTVAGYILAVGVFFCVSALFEGAFLDPEPPGKHYMVVISIIFIGAGLYSFYLINRGKLKKSGKSIVEVRQEAVEKMKDPTMLAQIALEDEEDKLVRKTAEERLKELKK